MQSISTKSLVAASYNDSGLEEKTVLAIADKLTRLELKAYIKALTLEEKKRTILVDTANTASDGVKKLIAERFSGKQIVYRTDPTLLLGLRITDNDTVYESNLKETLSRVTAEIEATYE